MVELEVEYDGGVGGGVWWNMVKSCLGLACFISWTLVKRASDPYLELSLAGLAISGRGSMVTFATTPDFHSLVLWKWFPLSAAVTSNSS